MHLFFLPALKPRWVNMEWPAVGMAAEHPGDDVFADATKDGVARLPACE